MMNMSVNSCCLMITLCQIPQSALSKEAVKPCSMGLHPPLQVAEAVIH